jgi:pSer/pThr/pTyr-binding forkhead associated (FHA) protein
VIVVRLIYKLSKIIKADSDNLSFCPFSLTNKNTGEKLNLPYKGGTIGRAGDIVISDKYVSSTHMHFSFDQEYNLFVKDLGSKNGTLLNGEEIESNQDYQVNSGDIITIGNTVLLAKKEWSEGYTSH